MPWLFSLILVAIVAVVIVAIDGAVVVDGAVAIDVAVAFAVVFAVAVAFAAVVAGVAALATSVGAGVDVCLFQSPSLWTQLRSTRSAASTTLCVQKKDHTPWCQGRCHTKTVYSNKLSKCMTLTVPKAMPHLIMHV